MQKLETTTSPVEPSNITGATPEFGRVADLTRIFGVRRGTAYNLLRDGKIRGCLLRVRGQKSGVRLFDMESVRQFIRSQMETDGKATEADTRGNWQDRR